MFAIVDLESTGGKPADDRIMEIAIVLHDGQKIVDQYESLINPERDIQEFVQRLTGIKEVDGSRGAQVFCPCPRNRQPHP